MCPLPRLDVLLIQEAWSVVPHGRIYPHATRRERLYSSQLASSRSSFLSEFGGCNLIAHDLLLHWGNSVGPASSSFTCLSSVGKQAVNLVVFLTDIKRQPTSSEDKTAAMTTFAMYRLFLFGPLNRSQLPLASHLLAPGHIVWARQGNLIQILLRSTPSVSLI